MCITSVMQHNAVETSSRGGQFMSDLESKDWRELSEAASREQDPQKLMDLIRALNKALERREREQNNPNQSAPGNNVLQMERGRRHNFVA
jgi:hypothetical protein